MKLFKKLLAFVLLLAFLAVPVLALTNLQAIRDWVKLRGYNPPATITELASQDTMNAYTRHLFYLNRPQLLSTVSAFRQACPEDEQDIVLGCYHSGQNGIFIYNVQNPSLAGVQQVTAAHEVLHAVYARLSSKDRTALNAELENYYNSGQLSSNVAAEVKLYQQTEPNNVMDEMSCTFGTEVANLPSPLESYYKKYFTDRQAIVNFSNQYESVFTANQQQIQSLNTQINQLKTELSAGQQTIKNEESSLSSQNQSMQNLLSSGQTAQYNAQVDSYDSQLQNLRSLIASYNDRVNQVNDLVVQYNGLAYTQKGLDQSIDTRLQTQSPQ